MSRGGGRPERVRIPYVEQLAERLSPRDWSIISTIHRLRIISGLQLERLNFHELTGRSRSVKRAQVLKRLVDVGILVPLPRRVGTANRGSAQQRYVLDSAGQRLAHLRANRESREMRVRRPRPPGDRYIEHALALSELYVELIERSRRNDFTLVEFQVEGDAYWPNGLGGWLKMDAFVQLERGTMTHYYWWYEADMATEDLSTTIRDKLLTYLDFVQRGQLGPDDVVPRVLIGVPDRKRQDGMQGVLDELPKPADELFLVADMTEIAQLMIDEITRK
jgi:hypothetical protein